MMGHLVTWILGILGPMASPDAFFVPDGARFVATGHTQWPWGPGYQHAGPPSALLARAIQRVIADDPALRITRLTVELLAPVPIATLDVATGVLRAGKKVRRVEAMLSADGKACCRATALCVRTAAVALPAPPEDRRERMPPPDAGEPYVFGVVTGEVAGYAAAVEARRVKGGFGMNPTAVWIRSRVPLVLGEPLSPLARVLIAADSGNGCAVVLDPRRFTFINADLTVALHREPVGEWVCLEASTWPEPDGVGLAESRLHDARGPIGWALQSLVVETRPAP
jgi:hypothetical protein